MGILEENTLSIMVEVLSLTHGVPKSMYGSRLIALAGQEKVRKKPSSGLKILILAPNFN